MTTDPIQVLTAQLLSRRRVGSANREQLAREELKHRTPFVRRIALECLTSLRPPDLKRVLVEGLSDRSWEVRLAAVEGIASTWPTGQAVPIQLSRLLRDRNQLVRLGTAEAIGMVGDRTALRRLIPLLNDRAPLVRRYVAEAIGRLGTARQATLLQLRLDRERSNSGRLGLYHGLYLLGVRSMLSKLTGLLCNSNYAIRSAAAMALEDTCQNPNDARLAKRAIREALAREKTPARENMQKALVTLRRGAQSRAADVRLM
jgi:HEAT repeat protein